MRPKVDLYVCGNAMTRATRRDATGGSGGPAHRMSAANLPDQIAESEPLSSMRQLLRNASLSSRPMSAFIINPHSSLPFFRTVQYKVG